MTTAILRAVLQGSLIANGLFAGAVYMLAHARDAARIERDALRADVATQRAEFEAKARRQEREQHQALAGLRVIFDKEMTDANTKHDAVVAAQRAGTLKLRQHWEARVATAELSTAAAAAARADEGAELRATGAGDLVRVGARCDARIRALQGDARICRGGTP